MRNGVSRSGESWNILVIFPNTYTQHYRNQNHQEPVKYAQNIRSNGRVCVCANDIKLCLHVSIRFETILLHHWRLFFFTFFKTLINILMCLLRKCDKCVICSIFIPFMMINLCCSVINCSNYLSNILQNKINYTL